MVDNIRFPTRKFHCFQKNTLFYPIIGHTNTKELLLTKMKTKYNAPV